MKIAFASNGGRTLDCHFGHCNSFTIFDFGEKGYRLLESRSLPDPSPESEECDKFQQRVDLILDCTVLFVVKIGGDATKRVLRAGIILLQSEQGSEIVPQLEQLSLMLKDHPPLWLVKTLKRKN
ncbi:NifB/NifX family molybdenum-iron cluster-binding protein [Paenibacillus sp. S150]|uniref:NifB/NifX family molybdenum-iron cluster-binding protein n=1 Tax=Paenibacillus sp. S150 TaxID=2749826 RepID=UPI001C565B61|nr:NifB/NifX family molybdenum-iron cluster-binding protein [Paenibacillus sp. S150]MBW4082658.1 nitrogen fixation protein NifX [Paenibacillus sp. S150]